MELVIARAVLESWIVRNGLIEESCIHGIMPISWGDLSVHSMARHSSEVI